MRSARSPSAPTADRDPAGEGDDVGGNRGPADGGEPVLQEPVGVAVGSDRAGAGVGGQLGGDGVGATVDVGGGDDVDREPEPVKELGSQVAFLGVHRGHEDEPGRVGLRDAFALDSVHAGDGDVEEHVDEVVGEQVDLVDVEDAPVRGGEQAGPEPGRAGGEQLGEVEGSEHAVLGGAEGKLDEGGVAGEQVGEPAGEGRLGAALLAPEEDAAEAGLGGGEQQRELGVVLGDDRGERQPGHRASCHASASSSASRRARRASGLASQRPRSTASSSRSAMDWSAQGFDRPKNFRTSGSAT